MDLSNFHFCSTRRESHSNKTNEETVELTDVAKKKKKKKKTEKMIFLSFGTLAITNRLVCLNDRKKSIKNFMVNIKLGKIPANIFEFRSWKTEQLAEKMSMLLRDRSRD